MRVEVYKRDDDLWDWRLIADNGEQVAESSQGYTERNDALEGWGRISAALVGNMVDADDEGDEA